jgi:hypothetical protein
VASRSGGGASTRADEAVRTPAEPHPYEHEEHVHVGVKGRGASPTVRVPRIVSAAIAGS